jgi:acetyl-CoA carboxylase biotin carboxyl carrier protein
VSDRPDLTPEDVKQILRLVDEAGVEEFELETARFTVRFRRGDVPHAVAAPSAPAMPSRDAGGLLEVTAPMVGTFYRSPAPGEPPYVEVGSAVEPESQVCIIEVMKLMSTVVAGVRGTIAEICCASGEPVQFGDVLFRVRP